MRRDIPGTYVATVGGGESVRAFVPNALPPVPDIDYTGGLPQLLERATLAVGRLDTVNVLLPDPTLFVYSYVRKEAVLSSQIEGTRSSISDLLIYEAGGKPESDRRDVLEVSNAVAAMYHGIERLRGGFPVSNRLIREMHAKLMASGRGSTMTPGEFRRSQNWIGGSRPGNAQFVPPPPDRVQDCMADLERFIHAEGDEIPALVRAGLAHVQFETIHPFLDGNGRVGRLLVTLMLCNEGMLREPVLYLSLFFKRHRSTYYKLLNHMRHTGDWESWLAFFLGGVCEIADEAVHSAKFIRNVIEEDRLRIGGLRGRAGSALRVYQSLLTRPVCGVGYLSESTGLTGPTVRAALRAFEEYGNRT